MKNWTKLKKELLEDKTVNKEYIRLAPKYEIISQLIKIRLEKGITQKEIALRMGTKQSAIARLESGHANPTLDFLQKLVSELGGRLSLQFR